MLFASSTLVRTGADGAGEVHDDEDDDDDGGDDGDQHAGPAR
jgi:hypothetical protein